MATTDGAARVSAPQRPTITLPLRSAAETLFANGLSPGPLTMVSNFFSENADFSSFSQLLAGAMASPSFSADNSSSENVGGEKFGFRQNRPVSLVVAHSPVFIVPPGLSPSGFLNSPGFLSPLQSPFGMTHQQALAQVTAQAALSQCYMSVQIEHQASSLAASTESLTRHQSFDSNTTIQPVHTVISEPESSTMESSEVSQSDRKSLPISAAMDKPMNDGYNWRKYGQKQVKTSEYLRSYYNCSHLNCPVKKKVERNFDGKITEIIYKGQHNHEIPQSNKRAKDRIDMKPNTTNHAKPELGFQGETEMSMTNESSLSLPGRDQASTQLTPPLQVLGSCAHVEMGDCVRRLDEDEDKDDGPNPKRRYTEVGTSKLTVSYRTVTEPKIVVQTRSEVDLLDDGYKWRKYGQKVVKGSAHPRSYYKCTSAGCNVRKHVERDSADPKAVVTTYEGKHNHDLPADRKNSHNTANNNTSQVKSQKAVAKKPALLEEMGFRNNDQRPVLVQLKEEKIIA
ncbi:WRKY transcription factor 4 [Actinidia chinensis var. chinensis]|uniref:WRKY transcription factor 4 n=1 Tax=Actinidia chinensis var. chinensis TaxID=1590841 RepID=A0A2R6RYN2_ACTCC|nr:WRKY transcription factor 4 [Actinidia chinensis var. chinensis]